MSELQQASENRMGTESIGKLMVKISLPVVISMLISGLYNMVDGIFVAQLSENALAGVSLISPITSFRVALGVGTAVGVNARLTRSLGEGNSRDVGRIAGNGLFLNLVYSAIYILAAIFFTKQFVAMQTTPATDPEVIKYGEQYVLICTIGSIGFFVQSIYERFLLCTGKTIYSMISQGTGAIVNIILDPILIFGYLGFPRMEVVGAAIATALGMIASAVLAMIFHYKFNKEIKMSLKDLKPHLPTIGIIYKVGFPTILMQSMWSVVNLGMNKILMGLSSTSMAVMGAYSKLESFATMPIVGLNFGLVSLLSYNYGAKKGKRMVDSIKVSFLAAMGIMLIATLLFEIIPRQLMTIYDAQGEMMNIGIAALRIIGASYVPYAVVYMANSVFQSLDRSSYCLWISIIKQIIILLPAAYFLAKIGAGEYNVWWAFLIAELVAMVIACLALYKVYREKITPVLKLNAQQKD